MSDQIFCITISWICSAVFLSLDHIKHFLVTVLFAFLYIIFYKQAAILSIIYVLLILCFKNPNNLSLLFSSFAIPIPHNGLYHIDACYSFACWREKLGTKYFRKILRTSPKIFDEYFSLAKNKNYGSKIPWQALVL